MNYLHGHPLTAASAAETFNMAFRLAPGVVCNITEPPMQRHMPGASTHFVAVATWSNTLPVTVP